MPVLHCDRTARGGRPASDYAVQMVHATYVPIHVFGRAVRLGHHLLLALRPQGHLHGRAQQRVDLPTVTTLGTPRARL